MADDLVIDVGLALESTEGFGGEVAKILGAEYKKALKKLGLGDATINAIADQVKRTGSSKINAAWNDAQRKIVANAKVNGKATGTAYADGMSEATRLALAKIQRDVAREMRKIAESGLEATKVTQTGLTSRTRAEQAGATRRNLQSSEASVKRAIQQTAQEQLRTDSARIVSYRKLQEVALQANARIVASTNDLAATYTNAAVRRIEADARVTVSGKRLRGAEVTAEATQDASARRRLSAAEFASLQRVAIEQKGALQAARAAGAIDVAETQQRERRNTLRLQRFNALTLQVTQSFLTKLRDRRLQHDNQVLQDQRSADKRQENQLRETLSRRQLETQRFQAKTTRIQQESTAALLGQRTQTGVIGAARGISPLGASLRSLALVGGGVLSARAIFTSAQAFLTNFRRLGAITGATDAQLKQLRATAIALGNDLSLPGVSAGDATEALTRLVQAGFTVDQAIGAAKGTLLLARNNVIDFGEAAQFTGSAINSFGIDASKALLLVDVAQKSLISGGGQSFTELQQAIQQSGAVFAQFFTETRGALPAFEDLNIALDILAKNGLRGSDAGTSLKTFLLGLGGNSDQAKKKIDQLSTSIGENLFFNPQGQVLPFIEIIKNLRESLAGLTQESQLGILKTIFGTDAFRAAAIFIGQTDAELQAFEKTIRESAGASEALGKAVNQGMKAAFDNLASVIETAGILLIEKIDKPVGRIVTGFADLTSKLLQGQGAWEVARAALAGMAVALGAILAAKGAVEVLGVLKGVVIGMASPAKLAAVGLLGIGAAIGIGVQKSDEFREALGNLASFVDSTVLGPLRRLREAIFGGDEKPSGTLNAGQLETLPDQIGGAAGRTNPFFDAIGRTINEVVIPAMRTAGNFVSETLVPAFLGFATVVRNDVLPVLGAIGRLLVDVGSFAVSEIANKVLPIVERLGAGLTEGFSGITTGAAASGVVGFLQDVARVLGSLGRAATELFTGNFADAGSRLATLGTGIGRALLSAVQGIDFGAIALTIFQGIGTAARKVGSALTTVFSEPVIKAILGAAAAIAAVAAQVAVNFAIGFAQGLKGRADDIQRVITDVLKIVLPAAILGTAQVIRVAMVTLFKTALSGPLGLALAAVATTILGVFGAKVIASMRRSFFSPLRAASQSTMLAVRGDVDGARTAFGAFRKEQQTTAREAANTRRLLGPGVFGGFVFGSTQAIGAIQKVGKAIGVSGQEAIAGLAAATAGYFAGLQSGFSRIVGLAGLAATALTAFATAGPIAGGLALGLGAIGFLFGDASRKAQEAKRAIEDVTVSMKSGATAADGFTAAIADLTAKSPALAAGMRAIGLSFEGFLGAVSAGGPLAALPQIDAVRTSITALVDELKFAASLDLGTGNLAPQLTEISEALTAVSGALTPEQQKTVREILADLGKGISTGGLNKLSAVLDEVRIGMAGSEEAADAFSKALGTIIASLQKSTPIAALGLEIETLAKQMRQASADGQIFADVLPSLIPDELESQLRRIGKDNMADLAAGLKGSTIEFRDFQHEIRLAGLAMGLTEPELDALQRLFRQLRGAASEATTEVNNFSSGVEIARRKRLDRIAEDWGDIEDATRDASAALDVWFAKISGGNTQRAIDDAIVGGVRAIENAKTFFEQNPNLSLIGSLLGDDPVAHAQVTEGVQRQFEQVARDLVDSLPDSVKANESEARAALAAAFGPIIEEGVKAGIDPGFLSAIFNIDEIVGALDPFRKAATRMGELMRQTIAVELSKPIVGSVDLPTGVIPEIDVPNAVLQAIRIDPNVTDEIKKFMDEHPFEATAAINEFTFDQKKADTALSSAILSAQSKLPPIKINATITDIDILDRALQGISFRINRAVSVGQLRNSAEGNIFTSPAVTTIAEGGRAEAVIPLTKPRRALELLRRTGLAQLLLGGSMGSLTADGKSVGEGAALGLTQTRGMVGSAAAGLANMISSTFRSILGIHSPSTVFEKYGRDIIDGLVKGLKEGAKEAGGALRDFVEIFVGAVTGGGARATGFDQLAAAARGELIDVLKSRGSPVGARVDEQAEALRAIADLAKDSKGFKSGLSFTSAAGAANRSTLIDVIGAARDAIVENLSVGDRGSAGAVLTQLQAALAKVNKTNKGNAPVIAELLNQFGLGGNDPLTSITQEFASVTEELRRLIQAEEARVAQEEAAAAAAREARRQRQTPPQVNNSFVISSPYNPFEIARRVVRDQEQTLSKAIG